MDTNTQNRDLSHPEESPDTATSRGFFPPPSPAVFRRSLFLSAFASSLGAMCFSVVQGTIFNFFLEDLSLKDRLPWFMGLWYFGAIGTLLGSWILKRWGYRKTLFFVCLGASRLIWIVIGILPLVCPDLIQQGRSFTWMTILIFSFFFIHSVGGNAWLTWMADLVPPEHQSKYWSLRQVGVSLTSAVARLGFGYYIERHRNFTGYAIVFCIATVLGLCDIGTFFFVHHRRPKIRKEQAPIFSEFASHLREAPFRRLLSVYLLWSVGNSIIGPTTFYLAHDHAKMGVWGFSIADTVSLLAFMVFSLLWGKFSDRHGHKGSLVLCLLLQAFAPLIYFFVSPGQDWIVTLVFALNAIGLCGINLFMWPMLIEFTHGKGGREAGMAIFSLVFNAANGVAMIGIGKFYSARGFDFKICLGVVVAAGILRVVAAGIALSLPDTAKDTGPGTLIMQFVTTNPLRATYSFVKYVTGKEDLE